MPRPRTQKKRYIYHWDEIPLLVDVAYVCVLLGVCPKTVHNMIKRNDIVGRKVGKDYRITKESLQNYFAAQEGV